MKITSDGGNLAVPLKGISQYPFMITSPPSLSFGTVKKDASKPLTLTITDSSINALKIDSLWTKTKYFSISSPLSVNLIKQNDTGRVTIKFSPDTSKNFVDTLYLLNNSLTQLFKIPLNGNGTLTTMREIFGAPNEFSLKQNYPNPFNPSTTIEFTVAVNGRAILKIFNAIGQDVATLFDGAADAGQYQAATFDAKNFSSGIYFARLQSGGNMVMRKMLLIK